MLGAYPEQVRKHWLFAEEVREWLCEGCIPFKIWGLPASSPHASTEGICVKMVPDARRKIDPQPDEVVVSVAQKGRLCQILINPSYLVPWEPCQGSKVVVISCHAIGQVGKVVKMRYGCCSVELEASGKVSFDVQDIVSLL